jgi:Ca-activated chloride channel homolog
MRTQVWSTAWREGVAAGLAVWVALAVPVQGAGLLIADGGFGGVLEIVEQDVHVTINSGIAVTEVTQVFRNTEDRQVEALYTFPVPKGASVANFSMWINGKEMVGEVLEKERAREIYNSYKRKRQDPGLLEQVDYKTFEMRVFPIGARAEQRVRIAYYQELDIDHDWFTYVYPLATVTRKDIDSKTTGKFAIRLEAKSAVPMVQMQSPSHGDAFVIAKHTEDYYEASLETTGGSLARDVVLAGRLSRPHTGIDLVTSREGGADGHFYATITAGEDLGRLDTGMDYVFVIDISGSMGNDGKLAVSKESVSAFVEALGESDRFELMVFNIQPHTLFSAAQPVSTGTLAQAAAFLDSQQARGGTVLNPAITAAYKYGDPDRQLNVVILSDGMTEQRERRELLGLIRSRPRNARVFCIGVGNEVNRPLLEQLAQDSGGLAAFISRGDNFGRQAAAFRRKLLRPAAANLEFKIDGLTVYDIEPRVLPDLYHGTPVRIYGRYKGDGDADITLKGDIRGRAFKQTAKLNFPPRDLDNPEIERMWAWKRVDRLLKTADRNSSRQDVLDEIVALGESYSIVTEYTSFLVLENDGEYRRWKIDRRNAARLARDRVARQKRNDALLALRRKAVNDIGPQPVTTVVPRQAARRLSRPSVPTPGRPGQTSPRVRGPGQSVDFGTGPVGPLFLALVAWLGRRRKQT